MLTQDGYLYSMGFNENGVLGLGKSEQELRHTSSPQLVQNIYCISAVATGDSHSLALDVTKTVYAWGNSEKGAIGVRENPDDNHTPKELHVHSKQVTQLACGSEHSVVVTDCNTVYSLGRGDKGQLGIGYQSSREFRPQAMQGQLPSDEITQVCCGQHTTFVLTNTQ